MHSERIKNIFFFLWLFIFTFTLIGVFAPVIFHDLFTFSINESKFTAEFLRSVFLFPSIYILFFFLQKEEIKISNPSLLLKCFIPISLIVIIPGFDFLEGNRNLRLIDYFLSSLIFGSIVIYYFLFKFKYEDFKSQNYNNPFNKNQIYLSIIFAILFGIFLRIMLIEEPFDRDLMGFTIVSDRWVNSFNLYSQSWDHKPPMIYLIYSIFLKIFGMGTTQLFMTGLAFYILTTIGIYKVASTFENSTITVLSLILWAIMGNDLLLQANNPIGEALLNAFIIWALFFAIENYKSNFKKYSISLGFVFLFITFIKINYIFIPFFYTLFLLISEFFKKKNFSNLAKHASKILAIGIIGWLLLFYYFYRVGTFEDFFYAVFEFNRDYAGNIFRNLILITTLLVSAVNPAYIYFIVFIFCACVHFKLIKYEQNIIFLSFYTGSYISLASAGQFANHYFLIFIPLISISMARFLSSAYIQTKKNRIFITIIILLPTLFSFAYLDVNKLPYIKFGQYPGHGPLAEESKIIGKYILKNKDIRTSFVHWGGEPGVYFWSDTSSPITFSFNFILKRGSKAKELQQQFLNELIKLDPDYIIAKVGELNDTNYGQINIYINENYLFDKDLNNDLELTHFLILKKNNL